MELSVSDQSLLIFVDDTGHETLVPGHPIYGLGGCAIMAADLERVICHPWREVRRQVRGSADTPLHAAALGHPPRREDIEVVAGFFRNQPFARIGATVTVNTTLAGEFAPIDAIAGALKNRIVDIAKWTPFADVHVIFEASERADRRIEAAFGDFRLEENGRPISACAISCPRPHTIPRLKLLISSCTPSAARCAGAFRAKQASRRISRRCFTIRIPGG